MGLFLSPWFSVRAQYTLAEKIYFKEIVLGREYEDATTAKVVRWTKNIKIYMEGIERVPFLKKELEKVVTELNTLISGIFIEIVNKRKQANLHVFLGQANDYVNLVERNAKAYISNNKGLFYIYKNDHYEIEKGSIYVDTYRVRHEDALKHLLREELTQALGLMNDSYRYKKSIFYQRWSYTVQYLEIDKKLIQLLYNSKIKQGMSRQEVDKVLNTM